MTGAPRPALLASLSAALLAAALLSLPAAARAPDAQERAGIEEALRAQGFVAWDDIELEEGMWEVDDARETPDGREHDLKLDPQTLRVVSRQDG